MKTKTLKVRVKDKHANQLNAMARSVNFVWNYVNELSHRSTTEHGRFLSAYDIDKYTAGSSKLLGIRSSTIQEISRKYVIGRRQFKKNRLGWRKSYGSRRSLGWVPFKKGTSKWRNGQVLYNGDYYKVWDSHGLDKYEFRSGSFNQDSRGRWYFNVVVSVETKQSAGKASTGIDLGCKDAATDSNGGGVRGREYRKLESKLGIAQRARDRHRVRVIHAKIKNRRADALHKYSRKLVNQNAAIFVGNVSSTKLVKTKMAKSVLDAGWYSLKIMLEYKCDHAGIIFEVVDEAYSTQACSCCGTIPDSSPKGRTGLGIREWICSECGAEHDRDINAARNILAAGNRRLAEGISSTEKISKRVKI